MSLIVDEGETTVLIGPSGCGKSTVLRLVIGLVRPDAGNVFVEGEGLHGENLYDIRRRVGYVIQEGGLFPHMTARQNITLMARQLEWRREKILDRLDALTTLTGLPEDRLDAYPAQLSGGQRQRISLMRALMLDPDLLLLDEPLGALDPLIRADLQDELRSIFQALGKTVLLVTHDMHEAAFFGDTIVLMQEGRIVQQGTVDNLLDSPTDPFVTRFINAQRTSLR
jgi:osmoprotectant transport system ATP-binding protein